MGEDFSCKPAEEKIYSVAEFYEAIVKNSINAFPYGNHSIQMNRAAPARP